MKTLSLNVNMRGKVAVIIGGGAVALRKTRVLLAAGATVRVVSPIVCSGLTALSVSEKVEVRSGHYTSTDLEGSFLAVATTDDAEVNRQVATDAAVRGTLVAVADQPLLGDCIFPATLHRGDLEIAISTGGRCPSLAAEIRLLISSVIGEEYAEILEQLADTREKLLTDGNASTYNATVLRSLARQLIFELSERKGPP
jgi:precorrin-2 dehydrogenase/sirohydrochlorin ferrochelatase